MFVWCIVFKTCLTFNNNNSNHHYDDSLNDRKKRILLLLLFGYDAMARQKKTLDSFVCKTRERKTNEYAVYNNRIQCKAYLPSERWCPSRCRFRRRNDGFPLFSTLMLVGFASTYIFIYFILQRETWTSSFPSAALQWLKNQKFAKYEYYQWTHTIYIFSYWEKNSKTVEVMILSLSMQWLVWRKQRRRWSYSCTSWTEGWPCAVVTVKATLSAKFARSEGYYFIDLYIYRIWKGIRRIDRLQWIQLFLTYWSVRCVWVEIEIIVIVSG